VADKIKHTLARSKTMRTFIISLLLIGIALLISFRFLYWMEKQDEQTMKSAQSYEKCVKDKYNINPSAYYAEYGKYPYCDN